jgi:type IV pilus assembly protein PilM
MFGFGKNTFLGIDIGTSSIKIVELKVDGNKPVLSNYGWVYLEDLVKEKEAVELWAKYISRIVKEGKFKGRDAYVSVSSAGSLITLIEFPDMGKEELDQAIRFEAHKYVPVPLEEVVLSWDVVGVVNAEPKQRDLSKNECLVKKDQPVFAQKKIQVLLVAAPKNKIEKYEKLINESGLELKSIEIENFSMVRSLIGNDPGSFVVLDIGARVCNVILVEKGVIKVNRNIYSGGLDITRVIGKGMNIEEKRAERLKTSGENFLSGEAKMLFPSLENVVGEVKRVLDVYYRNNGNKKVDSLILSGGTAGLKGITEYFQNALNIKTIIGNPLGRIAYPKELEPKINQLKARLSVAVGLALKGVEEYLRK